MYLNLEQVELLRAKARRLLKSMLPFNDVEGDPSLDKYNEVCKDYGGDGTTCGLLCHWLLWRLGASAQNRVAPSAFRSNAKPIINRSETGFCYYPGEDLSRLVCNPYFVKTFGTDALQNGLRPGAGDIVYIAQEPGRPQNADHVFVFVEDEGSHWLTAESGQECGKWGRFRRDRRLLACEQGNLSGNTPIRSIMGWLPIDKLDYDCAP